MTSVVKRFLRYIAIDTESDESSSTCPSTEKQWKFARLLVRELKEFGLSDVTLDDNAYVMATVPATSTKKLPTIGFIAHMDTSPDMSGKDVTPNIIENYDGTDIVLNKQESIILSPQDFPALTDYIGKTLITTDGTTLLGADDKAGVAEIMTMVEYLMAHPKIEHGTIKIGFTPDEEIGRGADKFNVSKFNADFAYTVDGGPIGELEYENFNAAGATITIKGRNVHPGSAKNTMLNALLLAIECNELLPVEQRPEHTSHYEGFFHLCALNGTVEQAELKYIIRDHDRKKFEEKKNLLNAICVFIGNKYPKAQLTLNMNDQYYNMKEKILPVMYIVDRARKAMERCNVVPRIQPIRGGTDGARLSFMGLPTPNIFTGGHNFHGKYEFVCIESMQKAVNVLVDIVDNAVQ